MRFTLFSHIQDFYDIFYAVGI